MPAPTVQIDLPRDRIAAFCRKWSITELALFGSVLREDFRPQSDVDVLVSFAPGASWGLLEHAAMQEELSEVLGRKVDLVSRRAIEASTNRIRREAILASTQAVYVAR